MVRNPRNLAKKFIHWLAYHPGRTPVGCGRVCGLVFNRISVRFLMALVQWCSGYVSFLLWARRIQKHLCLDDYLTLLALATTVALIAQTTWAIVDEGQDKHEAEVSKTKFALIVRVGLFGIASSLLY